MWRITKIGLWLIPWWPILSLAAWIILDLIPRERDNVFIPVDGSSWIVERTAFELKIMAITRPLLLLSLAAFIAGSVLLIIALLQYLRRGYRSSSNQSMQPTADPRTAGLTRTIDDGLQTTDFP